MASAFLTVVLPLFLCFLIAINSNKNGVHAAVDCTGLNQLLCETSSGCRWRTAGGYPGFVEHCVLGTDDMYLWVKANDTYYSQMIVRAGQTLNVANFPDESFHGPQVHIDDGVFPQLKVATPPNETVAANPHNGGQLVPWDSNTIHNRPDQPPLVQPAGTFAYKWDEPYLGPTPSYPQLDSFEFYYVNATGSVFWGVVYVTVAPPNSPLNPDSYHCKDTVGGTAGPTDPWAGPYSYGPSDVCFQGAVDPEHRPWVTRQELPRIWEEVNNTLVGGTVNPLLPYLYDLPLSYGLMIDGVEFSFRNNALNITANGRLGHQGQRVYGFQPFKFEDAVLALPPWNLDDEDNMPQTMTFDKSCVATVAGMDNSTWGNTFHGLPDTASLNTTTRQCPYFNHAHLCANAPLLTVQQGDVLVNNNTAVSSPHTQPWKTLLDDCYVWTTGVFNYDLMVNYCLNGKYGRCEGAAPCPCTSHVFNLADNGDTTVITFDFFNTAIQPASQIDSVSQKERGWIEIHHKYEVTLSLRSSLDFAFETGIDIFTVDIQWFRYASTSSPALPTTVAGLQDRGLGINLVVYPEGYDAVYTPTDPRQDTQDGFKLYHNQVPRKIVSFTFYADPEVPSEDPTGLDPANRPVGMPSPYLGDLMSYDGIPEHLNVHTCAPSGESVGAATNLLESCDFQNLTIRLRQPNLGEDTLAPGQEVGTTWAWDGRLIFQFTLVNGEHPNFIMDMNYKQTALAVEGSFSGRSATCRTYPELVEAEVQSRDPNIPVQGVEQAPESQCAPGGVSLTEAQCGPSARESDGPSGPGFGCVWNYHRQTCIPGYSVTCQEPDAHVFGPTDRAMVVFDITNVDHSCVSVHSLYFEWTSGGITHKAYAVYPTGQTPPSEPGKEVWHVYPQNPGDPSYEYFKFNPLSELERNMYPLPQTNLWDYGFVFFPGAVNDNVAMQIVAVLRISTSCATRQNHRFRGLQANAAGSTSDMAFSEDMKLSKSKVSTVPLNSRDSSRTSGTVVGRGNSQSSSSKDVDYSPLIITLAAIFAMVVVAAIVFVVYVRRRNTLNRVPSTA